MAGYSGTPLARKLGIKPGHRVVLLGAPAAFEETLGTLPDGVVVSERLDRRADVVLFFTRSCVELTDAFAELKAGIAPAGGLWIGWPKKASQVPTDLDGNVVRAVGLAGGLVDNKVCAIDAVWSGLRFVWRLTDRPGAQQPLPG